MRKVTKSAVSVLAGLLFLSVYGESVFGVAAFARQTGSECSTCHAATGFPTLNAYGQAFKANAYTDMGGTELIEGDNLSIPAVMNFSPVIKMRNTYHKYASNVSGNTVPDPKNSLELRDEMAIFMAGRIGENMGFMVEIATDDWGVMRWNYKKDIGENKLGVFAFWTDGHGPGMSYEQLSTGNSKHLKPFEIRTSASAQARLKWGGFDAVHGLGAYFHNKNFFATASAVAPGAESADIGNEMMIPYVRAAATPEVAGGQLGIGFTWMGGNTAEDKTKTGYIVTNTNCDLGACATLEASDVNNTGIAINETTYMAIDAQFINNMGTFMVAYATGGTQVKDGTADPRTAISAYAEVAVIPAKLMAGIGFLNYSDPNNTSASTIGYEGGAAYDSAEVKGDAYTDLLFAARYYLAQNLKFQLEIAYNLDAGGMAIQPAIFGSF